MKADGQCGPDRDPGLYRVYYGPLVQLVLTQSQLLGPSKTARYATADGLAHHVNMMDKL